MGWLKNPYRATHLKSPSILLCVLLGFLGIQIFRWDIDWTKIMGQGLLQAWPFCYSIHLSKMGSEGQCWILVMHPFHPRALPYGKTLSTLTHHTKKNWWVLMCRVRSCYQGIINSMLLRKCKSPAPLESGLGGYHFCHQNGHLGGSLANIFQRWPQQICSKNQQIGFWK